MENKKLFLIVTFLFLFSISAVSAFGVALPYWDAPDWTPLKLAPGESKTVILVIQNTEPENLTVEATVNSPIAEITGKSIFSVLSGEIDKPAKIRIEVPKDAKVGTRYKVYTTFRQVTTGEGGMLRLSGALTTNFPVEVVGKQESEIYEKSQGIPTGTIILGVLGILIIAIIIYTSKKQKVKTKK